MARFICSVLLTALLVHRSDSANTIVTTKLYRELLENKTYEPAVRPSNGSDLPLLIQCAFVPILHDVDIMNQEIELRARMVMTWVDNRLAWNPDDYDGVSQLEVPVTKIWTPTINMYERISKHNDQSFQTENEGATIKSTGEISWVTMATTRSFCLMDMERFPYDQHTCNLTFTTFMHQKTQVQLIHNKHLLGKCPYKDYEIHHDVWSMEFSENDPEKPGYIECSYCLHAHANISFLVRLKRVNPTFATFTFAVPCLLLAGLSSSLVFCQGGSKEVPEFCLTCVLALTVFLMALYDMLPGTGFCNLGQLIVEFIVTVSCDTAVAVLMLKIPEESILNRIRRCCCGESKQDKKTKGQLYVEETASFQENGQSEPLNKGPGPSNYHSITDSSDEIGTESNQKENNTTSDGNETALTSTGEDSNDDDDKLSSYQENGELEPLNKGPGKSNYHSITDSSAEIGTESNQMKNNTTSDGNETALTSTGEDSNDDDDKHENDDQQNKKIAKLKKLLPLIFWFVLCILKVSFALKYFVPCFTFHRPKF